MSKDIETLWGIVKVAIETVELAQKGVDAARDALEKGKADLSKALEDLDFMRTMLAASDAKHDAALDAEEASKR